MQQPSARLSPRAAIPLAEAAGFRPTFAILLGAPLLLWPALYNGYPLVFADTGTYLSQAIQHYLGWDRPVFYSLFLLPLHLTLTTWPAIVAQALLCAHTLHLTQRALLPGTSPFWLVPLLAVAALATALPWFAAQLMPDVFTPLLVLALGILTFAPHRITQAERLWLVLFATFMIAAQQSSLPLAIALLGLAPLRRRFGTASLNRNGWVCLIAPPLLAVLALVAVNLVGRGRLAIAPYGNLFLLARVIYDGPGRDILQRDCPQSGWRLCPWRDRLPPTSDAFLWRPDSPVMLAGGHKAVSAGADAIILAALQAEPGAEAVAFLRNGHRQLGEFATGDGLHAWPDMVGRWIARDFPAAEYAAYAASRQARERLAVPRWMQALHAVVALAGVAGCAVLLGLGLRRRHVAGGFAAIVLLALLANAAIAGGLSTPHDRYQSRVMLLPPLVALLGGIALWRDR